MLLKCRPRHQAKKLVDVLVDKLLNTDIDWKLWGSGLTFDGITLVDDWFCLRVHPEQGYVSLPFLQKRRLRRALKTRVRYEGRKLVLEQTKEEES